MDAVLQGEVESLDENTFLATWYGDESKALVTSEAPTSAQQVTQPPVPVFQYLARQDVNGKRRSNTLSGMC